MVFVGFVLALGSCLYLVDLFEELAGLVSCKSGLYLLVALFVVLALFVAFEASCLVVAFCRGFLAPWVVVHLVLEVLGLALGLGHFWWRNFGRYRFGHG